MVTEKCDILVRSTYPGYATAPTRLPAADREACNLPPGGSRVCYSVEIFTSGSSHRGCRHVAPHGVEYGFTIHFTARSIVLTFLPAAALSRRLYEAPRGPVVMVEPAQSGSSHSAIDGTRKGSSISTTRRSAPGRSTPASTTAPEPAGDVRRSIRDMVDRGIDHAHQRTDARGRSVRFLNFTSLTRRLQH
jgi:hypothetical protein